MKFLNLFYKGYTVPNKTLKNLKTVLEMKNNLTSINAFY